MVKYPRYLRMNIGCQRLVKEVYIGSDFNAPWTIR